MLRPPASTLIARALRLHCPRCGEGPMFAGFFRMHRTCAHCGLRFEREPGYFLGSIYVNYGLTALITTIAWIGLRFGAGIEGPRLLIGFAIFVVGFPLLFFRYARALWLALDCQFDASIYADQAPRAPAVGAAPPGEPRVSD